MVRSDENNLDAIGVGQTNNIQGGGIQRGKEKMVSEIRHQRRALSDISSNIVGVLPHRLAVVKKEFSGKPEINDKDPNFPVHRPITRKFAEQIAKKQALSPAPKPEESKEPVEPISDPSESENSVDDNKIANKMEEVEMVDIEGEPVIDIDSYDVKNPLAVVEYIEDIYDYYRKAEISSCVSATYMEQQDDINGKMRAILIDWLIEVHYKFELRDETLFLTVNLIDRFLERQTVLRKKLQLVGVTAMFLACKYEEITVPVVRDLVLLSDNAYTRKEVLDMERLMVNTLQFNMSVPTPYVFMRRFLKAAQSDKKLELLTFFIIELSLVEYEMLKYPPSLLAASAIYTAQCTITNSRNWSKTIESHTKYSEDQLLECSRLMVSFHQNAATGKLTGVHRKYSAFRFGDTSKTVPALFLLETSP